MLSKIKRYTRLLLDPEIEFIREKRRKNKKALPVELQLPITYKCNFNCVMCGMRNLIDKNHFSPMEIKSILSDPLYRNIRNVGINGGEPFLRSDLPICVDAIVSALPNLKAINIITNGYFTERILKDLIEIHRMCIDRHIRLNLSVSVDGICEMQDFMRGKKGAYDHIMETCNSIIADKNKYCDDFMAICTITRHNIMRICEVELWSEQTGIPVSYNIATVNKRINNENRVEDFSVFSDKRALFLAQEFFYKQYLKTGNEKYYGLFLYLNTGRRMAPCAYQCNDGVTLTPDGQLGYCATHSKNLGNAMQTSSMELFQDGQKYHKQLCDEKCAGCSHYMYMLNSKGKRMLIRDMLNNFKLNIMRKNIRKRL